VHPSPAEDLAQTIRNRDKNAIRRMDAIKEAVEIFAPKSLDGPWPDESDGHLFAAIAEFACDETEPALVREEAGDAVGLWWVWSGGVDDTLYGRMTLSARRAARRVLGEADLVEQLPIDPTFPNARRSAR
jgi:hypothetical protein